MIWPVAKLVGEVDIKQFAGVTRAEAEEMPIQIRHQWRVVSIRHGILVERVARAGVPAVIKIARGSELKHPACLPAKIHRDVWLNARRRRFFLMDIDGSETAPVGVVRVNF